MLLKCFFGKTKFKIRKWWVKWWCSEWKLRFFESFLKNKFKNGFWIQNKTKTSWERRDLIFHQKRSSISLIDLKGYKRGKKSYQTVWCGRKRAGSHQGGAESRLRLSDFASVPDSIGKKSGLVLSKFASPQARAKSASVALARFQQTCSTIQTVQSSKAVGSKAKQNRERFAGDAFIWTCPVCAWDFRAGSSDKCSKDRYKHIQKTHPQVPRHRFHQRRPTLSVVQTSANRPLDEAGWLCAKCKQTLPPLEKRPQERSAKAHMAICQQKKSLKQNQSKGATVHKRRFKKLSQAALAAKQLASTWKLQWCFVASCTCSPASAARRRPDVHRFGHWGCSLDPTEQPMQFYLRRGGGWASAAPPKWCPWASPHSCGRLPERLACQ